MYFTVLKTVKVRARAKIGLLSVLCYHSSDFPLWQYWTSLGFEFHPGQSVVVF